MSRFALRDVAVLVGALLVAYLLGAYSDDLGLGWAVLLLIASAVALSISAAWVLLARWAETEEERAADEAIRAQIGVTFPERKPAIYVRRRGSDTWHWCRNCSGYPAANYEVSETRPVAGELCNQCLSKDRSGNCA